MGWKSKGWILIGMLVCLLTATAYAQVSTTTVADTVYHANGTPASGTVLISWPAFTTSNGLTIGGGSTSATLGTGGALSVSLTPNAGATPMGTYYTVVFHLDDGSITREYWVIPVSSTPVKLAAIENTVLPTSVAMQTVSKAYVDNAIAAAVTGQPLDASSPYVLKTGDTMTGALSLPGDPVQAMDAADKNYVDTNVAALNAGLAQKVSTQPTATQTVTQPSGTQLIVNHLNDVLYASQYATTAGQNADGIPNAVFSPDCAAGCDIDVEHSYSGTTPYLGVLGGQTHLIDRRGGSQLDSFRDPLGPVGGGTSIGEQIASLSTIDTAALSQQRNTATPAAIGLVIDQEALSGGSNMFPEDIETAPYFKMAYSAATIHGAYNTQGQHTLMPQTIECFGVGDCLFGSQFVYASGGARDGADEGAHLHDTTVEEDPRVFEGTCLTGCTAGSTSIMLREDANGGTQGDGRFVIDMNPSKVISSQSTGGAIVGGLFAAPHASVQFSGTNFPVSVFLKTAQVVTSQSNNIAPGTVTVPIATSSVPSGFATSTLAIGNNSGTACVTDQSGGGGGYYEMAPYTVVDGTHLQLTLNKPHKTNATLAFGGLCGYGIEQTVDTVNGVRQLFPVVGSYSPTGLYYESLTSYALGEMNQSDAYLNANTPIALLTRTGGTVTAITASNLPYDLNGLTVTIAGAADSSFNGSYPITTIAPNSFTYAQAGANSSTTGGSASVITGGFAIYPMAEVLSVYDPAAHYVDGLMTLAPNTVAWAANDPVEEPHFFQESITADTEAYTQIVPRPDSFIRSGITYEGTNSGEMWGYTINNATPQSSYFGYGGTHVAPEAAYEVQGTWRRSMSLTAGEQAGFTLLCNGHGCNNWNSNYDLFQLQSAAGTDTMHYDPQTSIFTMHLRGSNYSFAPTGVSLGALNAASINASALPLFGPSGPSHAQGAVPDPGSTAGNTRFLREDGTWSVPTGAGGGSGGGCSGSCSLSSLYVGPAASTYDPDSVAHFTNSGVHDAELEGTNAANARSAFMLSNNYGGVYERSWEFGTDVALNGTRDYYIYNYAVGSAAVDIAPSNDVTLSNNLHVGGVYQGPATAPTGGCSTVGWAFSQDGHASFCNGSSWSTKL